MVAVAHTVVVCTTVEYPANVSWHTASICTMTAVKQTTVAVVVQTVVVVVV